MNQLATEHRRQRTKSRTPLNAPEWISFTHCQTQWHVDERTLNEFFDANGLRLDEWIKGGQAEIIKKGAHRTVYRLHLKSGRFYLKHFKVRDWQAQIQNFFRPCKALLESNAARMVRELGIPTFESVALGRKISGKLVKDNWLITREIENATPLSELAPQFDAQSKTHRNARVRNRLISQLGELVARLHHGRLIHRDLHAENVLVRIDSDGRIKLWLVDLHAVVRKRSLTPRSVERNLSLLNNMFARTCSARDRLRFFRSYWNELKRLSGSPSAPPFDLSRNAYRIAARRVDVYCQKAAADMFRKNDRKWVEGNRRLIIADSPQARCRGIAAVGKPQLNELRDDPERLFAEGNLRRWEQRTPHRRVALIDVRLNDNIVCCRVVSTVQSRQPTRSMLFGKRYEWARLCWESGHALIRRSLKTPTPMLFVIRYGSHSITEYLLTETVPETVALSQVLSGCDTHQESPLYKHRLNRLTARLADELAWMHQSGVEHQGMTADGIHVSTGNEKVDVWWPAHPQVIVRRRLWSRHLIRALANLDAALGRFVCVTRTRRLQFLKHYLGSRFRGEWKTVWRKVSQLEAK